MVSPTRSEEIQQATARHHGLPLLPHPSDDVRDPLRWPRCTKIAALFVTAFVNFTANFAGAGFSVATTVLEKEFDKSQNQINALLTFNFLLLGVGNYFWVPCAVKFGKRPTLIVSVLLLFIFLIWTANARTYTELLAARCLTGFVSAAGESIVPSIVTDMFFLHERAAMMSTYTILTSSATAIGPLIAAIILQYTTGNWRVYIWVCAALAGSNMLAIFFQYPESNFHRPIQHTQPEVVPVKEGDEKEWVTRVDTISHHRVNVVPQPYTRIWTNFCTINHDTNTRELLSRPLKMLAKPAVLLAVYIYGTSLASQVILIFAFPSLLLAPPYLFTSLGVGLIQIAAIIGFMTGCFAGGYLADIITARAIAKQRGLVYPEQRLVAMLPGWFIAPAGCILVAFACSEKLEWVAIAFGFGMVSFGTIFGPNIAITYVVECYPDFAAESLVAINVFKNLVAFLFLYTAVDWVNSSGWIQVYMIMFMLVTLGMIAVVPFYLFGRKWRGETKVTHI